MDRLVIFCDANLFSPRLLLEEIFRISNLRKDIEICGVVDTARQDSPGKMIRIFQFLGINLAAKVFNPEIDFPIKTTSTINIYDICRKYGTKVTIPPGRNINSQEFVNFLKETVRPTIGISVACLQIFKKPIIEIFEVLVNYHTGLVPKYRGVATTRWSCYFNEEITGYTYHIINEAIDDGNILVQDAIPVASYKHFYELEYIKTIHAIRHLEQVIEMMVDRSRGRKQEGLPAYFSRKDFEAVTTIENPSQLTFDEIDKRLKNFGPLRINIGGRYYPVTKFKKLEGYKHCPKGCFMTCDNVVLKSSRFLYLPLTLYEIYSYFQKQP
jgi:folate-dependent phosphoribosylglycinamide formyltransferase PurN